MKQPNQHPCLIAHAIVIVHALYIFTVSIFSFTDWFNKRQSGDLADQLVELCHERIKLYTTKIFSTCVFYCS